MTNPKQRGGTRPGAGRPKKEKSQKRVKVAITMRRDHYELTKTNRSAQIERALDLLNNKTSQQ